MPDLPTDIGHIDDQIAVARQNLRELIELAAVYSSAADDDLVAQRIADQEARLELLTKQRRSSSKNQIRYEEKRHAEKSDQEEYGGDRG